MAYHKKTIDQVEVAARRVLMRVDFNVPLDRERQITDDRRIRLVLPSVRSVIDRGGRAILMSHLGRPRGAGFEPALSLAPVAERLRALLDDVTVHFASEDCLGQAASEAVAALGDGEVLLLENLRFHAEEKAGGSDFAASLAAYGDVYCNEAFGASHREDASMLAVPVAMEGKPRVAGLLLQRELDFLSGTLEDPVEPFVAVLGGAKVSDKLGAIRNLMDRVETILIGGAMAYTPLKAQGIEVGSSLVEEDMLAEARQIIDQAAASPTDLILPHDHTCGRELSSSTTVMVSEDSSIPDGWMGLDLGPETLAVYASRLRQARTIVWNGPVGVFETPPFHVGTKQIASAIAAATADGAVSVIGGGDTAAAAEAFGLAAQFTHVSTGGGASLQMLEGRPFPSVEVLEDA